MACTLLPNFICTEMPVDPLDLQFPGDAVMTEPDVENVDTYL